MYKKNTHMILCKERILNINEFPDVRLKQLIFYLLGTPKLFSLNPPDQV